jgi:hypothetical protein
VGAFNGTGTFVRSYTWVSDAANGINITASRFDTEDNGFASGLSNCITRDGQGIPTANIVWGNFNLTGVGTLGAVTATISGNGTIAGTLGVTGNTTVGGTLAVTGTLTATGGLVNSTTISDGQGSPAQRLVGYRALPFTGATAGRTLALTDVGMGIPATGTVNVPTNASVAFSIGDTASVYNNSGSSISITASGGVTLRLVGSASTGTRTLAQRGICTLLKVGTDEWVATGGGVS